MKDNSDIPLPIQQLRSRVMVYAIINDVTQQYEEVTKGYVELVTDQDEKQQFHYLEVKDDNTHEVTMRSSVQKQNNFGKQKGSIISWTDEEQTQYHELALSFEKQTQCDIFWRSICQKIGKSYLQINGTEKLEIPNASNLNYLLEKAKNSIDLVDYNIIHSEAISQGLREVFEQMKRNNDEMGIGMISRIISAILSPSYSMNAIQNLLLGDNFTMILELQQFKKHIDFKKAYDQKIGQFLKNKFLLPDQIFKNIELNHRATFYRENVLDLAVDNQLQSLMFMISKETLVKIMGYINRARILERVIKCQNYPINSIQTIQVQENESQSVIEKKQRNEINGVNDQVINNLSKQKQKNELLDTSDKTTLNNCNIVELTKDKLQFILQALIIYSQITSEHARLNFRQNIYSCGIMQIVKVQLQNENNLHLNEKALEILFYVSEIDKQKFFEYLINNFKKNSTDNLLKTLMKKYMNTKELRNSILSLIESFLLMFNSKPENLNFFIGTFVFSIFSISTDCKCIISLLNTLFSNLQNSSSLYTQIIKSKVFEKISTQYRTGSNLKNKSQQLQIVKLLKNVIIEQAQKKQLKNKEIEKIITESGFFECCLMIYFKHSLRYNIISSSMLQNFKLIQKMDYGTFDSYLIKQYSENQCLKDIIIEPLKQKHIQYVNKLAQLAKQDQYKQVDRAQHQIVLQNQQQDTYLMMADQQETDSRIKGQGDNTSRQPQEAKQQANSQLQDLKRMRNQMLMENENQEKQQQRQREIRKLIKKIDSKGDRNQQSSMEICFDLPDMNQFEGQQVKES